MGTRNHRKRRSRSGRQTRKMMVEVGVVSVLALSGHFAGSRVTEKNNCIDYIREVKLVSSTPTITTQILKSLPPRSTIHL